ncbi:MAG: hypothetical protein V4579_06335 [Pseudomonadota bacterium]
MLGASAASAQEAQTGADEAAQQQSYNAGEIIVTATKREQSLNKIGLTVSAFSGEQLRQ